MFKAMLKWLSGVMTAMFLLSALTLCQSIVVTPKKVVYRRAGDVPDYKRTFKVRYPVFNGHISKSATQNLKSNTDYWRLFEMSLEENLKGDEDWISRLDYQVKYNKNGFLAIWLTMEGSGAYPDSSTKYLVLDLRTGNEIKLEDLFERSKLAGLRDLIRRKMKAAENRLNKEMGDELQIHRQMSPEFYPRPEKLELKDLHGFSISERGVTFLYDYEYAHVSEALEPPGKFFAAYTELRTFIRRDGLLARFIR